MSTGTLDRIVEHLQFIGYETVPLGEVILAKHPRKPNIALTPLRGSGILITALFNCTDEAKWDRSGYLDTINALNTRAVLARFFADNDSNLRIDAWYPDAYDRHTFSTFMDLWDRDCGLLLEIPEIRRYLK